ncbi:MAG TPA: dihydroorotase [Rhodospirillales bacterium]|nr:dihydroorotase [Rhodospirillales bacterium]
MTVAETTFDVLVKGGVVATTGGLCEIDVGVRDGRIAALGSLAQASAAETLDCRGLHVLPGVIDTQVHFREPGMEHKEDIATGTAAAALGGVTAVFEMPNTRPPTTGEAELAEKCRRAEGRAWVDIAFYVGATPDNAGDLARLERLPGCAGVKVFMGSSTGNLLVAEDADVARVLASGSRRVAVHAEDETRLRQRYTIVAGGADPGRHAEWRDVETAVAATRRLLALAELARRRVHVLHVSTAEEMTLLAGHRELATVEVTPQHLTLEAPGCYEDLDSFAQMNPPIRDARHRAALWQAIGDGIVDCIGSDHAPHTREEKKKAYPESPSGMPGVQTLLPIMLDHVAAGRLSLQRLVDLTSAGPARLFGLAGRGRIGLGYSADLSIVDLKERRMITHRWIASRCGWTPFDGMTVTGWPVATIVRGRIVMCEDALQGEPCGGLLRFLDTY